MRPYLSIIIAASNAGYGGDFIKRLQQCVYNKFETCCMNDLMAEIIIVEWNPPRGVLGLREALNWQAGSYTLAHSILRVPREIHERYYNPGGFPFLEYMAKNVGIRRASGKFILCTNADVLLSNEMAQRLAQHDLAQDCFYRANRQDLDEHGNVYRINYANGSYPPDEDVTGKSTTGVPYSLGMLHFNASGDFMLMSRENWLRLKGYPENTGYLVTLDGEMVHIASTNGLRQVVLSEPIFHQHHHHGGADSKKWYMPPAGWSDLTPRGTMNWGDDWGLKGVNLETQVPPQVTPTEEDKHQVIKTYAQQFGLRTFVETGTYLGETVQAVREWADDIYSIEINHSRYVNASERFRPWGSVRIVHGDSGQMLEKFLYLVRSPALFWLDAHRDYQHDQVPEETPIFRELTTIAQTHPRCVVLIDDARLFGTRPTDQGTWPTIEDVRNHAARVAPHWKFELKDDIIRFVGM